MITTIEQLLLNHYTILTPQGKLYSEWHVKQAYELGKMDGEQNIKPKKKNNG